MKNAVIFLTDAAKSSNKAEFALIASATRAAVPAAPSPAASLAISLTLLHMSKQATVSSPYASDSGLFAIINLLVIARTLKHTSVKQ